jgi:16S rRNA (guanine527-N7)-methyltransferase
LARYVGLVLEWGARINLTGAKTPEALVDEHIADAWALLPLLPPEPFRFVDVGSGAGLPGLVLGLARPDAKGVLLEPRGKRHAFLLHAVRQLGLRGRVEVRRERLEAYEPELPHDVALSRATWPVLEWIRLAPRLVRQPGGRVMGLEGSTRVEHPGLRVERSTWNTPGCGSSVPRGTPRAAGRAFHVEHMDATTGPWYPQPVSGSLGSSYGLG